MKAATKTIILTGTHITPAIELINQLQSDPNTNWKIYYIGRKYTSPIEKIPAIEYELIPKMGIDYKIIDCGKLDRRYWPNTIAGLPKTFKGILQSIYYVIKIKPQIVVSFGGYLSVPVIFASWIRHIPSITHEQTSTISLSTKINSIFTTKVALSFDHKNLLRQLPQEKISLTGNLIRRSIFDPSKSKLSRLINNPKLPIIYITAGNQGSQKINTLILELAKNLTKTHTLIHQTGKQDYQRVKSEASSYQNYLVFDYIEPENLAWIFSKLSIIISRSGANSTQEIAQFGHKTILIPLPVTQQNEQKLNAKWLKSLYPRRVIILNDLSLTTHKLSKAIKKLSKISTTKKKITPKINYRLLQLIYEIL